MTVAQDKLTDGTRALTHGDEVTLKKESVRLMSAGVNNIFQGILNDLYNVGVHITLEFVGETDPTTDSAYAAAPIGSKFHVFTQSSGSVTAYKQLFKVSTGADGWREVLTEGLKTQTIAAATGTINADSDIVFLDYSTTGAATYNLPDAADLWDSTNSTTRKITCIDVDGNANTNNLALVSSDYGNTTYTMDADSESVTFVSDGTNLFVASGFGE